jgi:NAD(P)-dependent dehydrogenase (short-subunit alcohol dehydrogenase family)
VSLAFATEGARVVVADINAQSAEATVVDVRARGAEALAIVCDVRDEGQVRDCVERAVRDFGGIDILVNNAVAPPVMKPLVETTTDMFEVMWRSGPLGSSYFMQQCYPHLRDRRGNVVNVASRAGMDGSVGWSAYAAAKEAIRTLTKVAAREWGPDGIRVNAICPSADTPPNRAHRALHPELGAAIDARRPMGYLGDPELDIGRAVVMLASDYSRYVSGNTLMVDGGTCGW